MLAINKASNTHNTSCSGQGEISECNTKSTSAKESGGTNAAQFYREKLLGKNKKNKGEVEASLSLSAHLLQRGSVKNPRGPTTHNSPRTALMFPH